MKMSNRWILSARKTVQTAFLLGLVYIIWQTRYPLKKFVNPEIYFHLDPLVMVLTAVAERVFIPGLFVALFVVMLTVVFGRIFCGWFCPLGALQDIFHRALRTVFDNKILENAPSKERKIKYFVFWALLAFAVVGIQLAWFFDPIAITVRVFSLNIHPWVNRAIDGIFAFILKSPAASQPVENLYYGLKNSFLEVSNPVFPHAIYAFLAFSAVLLAVSVRRRFWCRYLCPLGGMLGIISRYSLLKRVSQKCDNNCFACMHLCRTNAIFPNNTYLEEECVMCMECVTLCKKYPSRFTFSAAEKSGSRRNGRLKLDERGVTRAQFLAILSASFVSLFGLKHAMGTSKKKLKKPLRPPGSLSEEEFEQRCIRCGNCMKVCPTNVLQPAMLEAGPAGIWTPILNTKIGYCEYQCNLCTQVCPTGAIIKLTEAEKTQVRIGIAVIDQRECLPWARGEECLVCEEHCPIPDKAIKLTPTRNKKGQIIQLPSVDPALCVGCAICEFKCPTHPVRAIKVESL
ncbi:MAG: 4Fe-4S binding protein [Endomicrobiales bacterium]|nr:4Fe-4S binding protein [Endomicrobiales bacterium]